MSREDPTEDIIRREITAARKILREDRIIQSHQALSARFDERFPAKDPKDPTPPAPEPKDPPADPPKRRSVWWGDEPE